jgi:hypothetical protein
LCLGKASAKFESIQIFNIQEHLKAQALKNVQGLKNNYQLRKANFFLAKSGGSFLCLMSQD